ncbi:sphingomyelin phosphodiesterase-like [Oppia nitens]|uniref:sphingomyelin phosphodiesterase-like n=1 Tax=Oppia nitens TaxID=1686743 RepID=UPI0023DC5EAC|nr:sphingomyelin phosphodiesterase-like [Oppia nitens]
MDLLSNAFRLLNLRKVVKELHSGKPSTGTSACMSCKFGFAMAQHLIQFGKDKEELGSIANYLCTTLDLASGRVCDGMVDQLKDELVQIISRINFSPNEICGSLLGESCAKVYNPLYNWTLPLTPIAKPVLKSSAQRSQPKSSSPKLRVLHLSDTHVDPLYVEGGDAVCGEPLCCRNASSSSSSAINMQNRAGFWGDYRDCDIPLRTLEQTLKFIESTHQDIDYIIWTGDIPPHDVWNQSRDGQLSIIKLVAKTVHKYLGNIPIYPALGNHESAPINSFPTPNIQGVHSISWLYSALEDIWSQWLPSHTLPLIKNGAYYAVMVKPGLKLISLNMNYCNNQNWWLLLNATDPAGQLQWLIRELQASELIGEKVHIIGHIPPGSDDCLQIWSRNMNRIVNRFEDTITGQFYGHTHQDEVEIFYETTRDAKNKNGVHIRPTNMAYIGPSVTTFGNVNPGYRIYTIDGDYDESTYEVLDYETYYLNLTEANINRDSKPLEYRLSYTAQQALGLQDLTPDSWHKLLLKMKNDTQLFNKFYEYFYNKSDNIGDNVCTSRQCRREILCRLMKAIAHDNYICNKFL